LSTALSARELTAPGRGAIRVLELSGEAALERVARMAQPGRAPAPGAFALLSLRDPRGALLDEAIVLTVSPERVELHLHGAPALVARILAELGVALEESPRGTLEQRAEACLARAPSEAAARVLLDQVQGARALARRGRVARWLVCPPRVMLAGPVNAGKSTLFNVLVGRERVVVDPTPGTTRDAVRERVHLGAYAVDLYDSAGERALEGSGAHSSSERAGQALAAELRRAADLVLWLVPPGHEPPRAEPTRTRIVRSCADLERADSPRSDGPRISARFAPAEARSRVEELVHAALGLPLDPWIPGAGVPFELEWVEELERDEPARLRRAVRAWLAPD
jgi:tRNA modification GTPase